MTSPGCKQHYGWRTLKCKTPARKIQLMNGDIEQWLRNVEGASAVSEVFSHEKVPSRVNYHAVGLQSTSQLEDHDAAYSEAQALLSDWMNSKLRLDLELEEEGDPVDFTEKSHLPVLASAQPEIQGYSNFDDMYNYLAGEEGNSEINSIMRDLMEHEVLDCRAAEELALDSRRKRKIMRDPIMTMEERHRQVRENRVLREAEKARRQREREAQREAVEEERRKELREEARRKEERRQEELVQQERVWLRRQMEEKRRLEQRGRQRERPARQTVTCTPKLASPPSMTLQQCNIQAWAHIRNLKCLQRHFSGWYSVLLEQRLRMGKAAALSDWRRKLGAWRAWRALAWAHREQREAQRTEEELRAEKRRCLLASEGERRRLLRRCINEWQLWCRMERNRRELLAQQGETRRKIAALTNAAMTKMAAGINVAANGKLQNMEMSAHKAVMAPPEMLAQPGPAKKMIGAHTNPAVTSKDTQEDGHRPRPLVPRGAGPSQPWQVTRRDAALTAGEQQRALQRGRGGGGDAVRGGRFEHRHSTQQRTIAEQRRLLKEQQEHIARLREEHSMLGLKLDAKRAEERAELLRAAAVSGPKCATSDPKEPRAQEVTSEADVHGAASRKTITRQAFPHPSVMAMEERARQRAQRRKAVEDLKRAREEDKLARMKAAEEERLQQEEEEKRRSAERRREEKRQARETEQEKQRQLIRDKELSARARQHYQRALLLWRGLFPWKRLRQLSQLNAQLADGHHNVSLLRRCTRAWQQCVSEALSQKKASVDHLRHRLLLRRGLSCWRRLKDWRMILEERADRFYRAHTLRRVLTALLDHVMQERFLQWDHQEVADQHCNRRVLRGCLLAWRQFPALQREERNKEFRRQQLRQKVTEVLPDFCSAPLECPEDNRSFKK